MSDIQDLIHKTSMDCIERGKIIERERIIKLLEAEQAKAGQSLDADAEFYTGLKLAIALIKGENNG